VRCVDRLSHLACFVAVLATVACRRDPVPAAASVPRAAVELQSTPLPASAFPKPDRRVAAIVSASWDNEDARDRVGEADTVMSLLGIVPGMGVADIGAGTGYYTVRLSPRVGPAGRVYAEDIMPAYVRDLRKRIQTDSLNGRQRANGGTTLSNIDVILGTADDPRLPVASVDRALLVHMYHEIEQPYALLYNLFPPLRPGARVGVVDSDRPTSSHGTPPGLLKCEMSAAGYRQIEFHPLAVGYLAVFEPVRQSSPDQVRAAIAKPGFSEGRC
jgi:predicted methyltransferase